MPSNLNIKYGTKTGTGDVLKQGTDVESAPGSIYAAENNIGEIEIYLDTPKASGSARKRLSSRVFVGAVEDLPSGTDEEDIRANYDVWIDTSGDSRGIATATSDGIMSKEQAEMLEDHDSDVANLQTDMNHMLTELHKLKLQIVSSSYWNDTTDNTKCHKESGNKIAGMLTIVLPDSAVPSGETAEDYRPVIIDNSAITTADVTQANSVIGGF